MYTSAKTTISSVVHSENRLTQTFPTHRVTDFTDSIVVLRIYSVHILFISVFMTYDLIYFLYCVLNLVGFCQLSDKFLFTKIN